MLDGVNTTATGLMIYNTNAAVTGGSGVSFYFFNGTTWERLITTDETGIYVNKSGDTMTGNLKLTDQQLILGGATNDITEELKVFKI